MLVVFPKKFGFLAIGRDLLGGYDAAIEMGWSPRDNPPECEIAFRFNLYLRWNWLPIRRWEWTPEHGDRLIGLGRWPASFTFIRCE
jgi:hypothetical protein